MIKEFLKEMLVDFLAILIFLCITIFDIIDWPIKRIKKIIWRN